MPAAEQRARMRMALRACAAADGPQSPHHGHPFTSQLRCQQLYVVAAGHADGDVPHIGVCVVRDDPHAVPVHFHMAHQTPPGTTIRNQSIVTPVMQPAAHPLNPRMPASALHAASPGRSINFCHSGVTDALGPASRVTSIIPSTLLAVTAAFDQAPHSRSTSRLR